MRAWVLAVCLVPACSSPSTSPASSSEAGSPDAGTPPRHDAGPPSTDAGPTSADAASAPPALPPSPAAYVTTDDLSQALAPVTITLGATGAVETTITVDAATTYQSILGFGASITDSSSYVMSNYLSPAKLTALLAKLFDPAQGVGLSFLRQPMGATDFSSAGNFSYDDGVADPTLAKFTIAQDLKATIPILKQALAIEPGLFILGTPWSPPAWMKINGTMDGTGGGGGNSGLSGSAYGPLAGYFVKWVQAYAAQGIAVRAVTPQNEPLNGAAAYPGMDLNAPSELALIAQHMGPAFQSAGLATQIWAYDHNWDVESYPAQILSDPTAGGFTEGGAFHCYGGDPSAMTTFHDAFPTKSVYMTECSGGGWQGDPFASTLDLAIDSTANWARVVALWNMALDENAGPQNHGCSTCRGVVTVNSASGDVTYNADYYALGHFAKFVRPGAVRIASTSSNGSLKQVAFANASGSLVAVAHNTGATSMTVRVGAGATAMDVTVPSNAAVTLTWTP